MIWMFAVSSSSFVGEGSQFCPQVLSPPPCHWKHDWICGRYWRQQGPHRISSIWSCRYLSRGLYVCCPFVIQLFPFHITNRTRRTLHPIHISMVDSLA